MLTDAQRAIIGKDLRAALARKHGWAQVLMLPVFLALLLPLGLLFTTRFAASTKDAEELMKAMKIPADTFGSPQEAMLVLMVDHLFPILFMLIPLMVASILGANSFVGERERKTMETLLYAPITTRELFVAKVVGALVPALIVLGVSALVFGLVIDVGGWLLLGLVPFPTTTWLVMLLWLAPAVALLAVLLMVWISARATTSQEAQQVAGLVVLPIVLMLVGQLTGVMLLGPLAMAALGLLLFVVEAALLRRLVQRFTPERLL